MNIKPVEKICLLVNSVNWKLIFLYHLFTSGDFMTSESRRSLQLCHECHRSAASPALSAFLGEGWLLCLWPYPF